MRTRSQRTPPAATLSAAMNSSLVDLLSVELLTEVLCRTPVYTHAPLKLVCKAFGSILRDDGFSEMWKEHKQESSVLIAFGGFDSYDGGFNGCMNDMYVLIDRVV